MKYILFLLLMLLMLVAACSPTSQGVTSQQRELIGQQIQTLMDELLADAEKLSPNAMAKYLSDDSAHSFFLGITAYKKTGLIAEVKEIYQPYVSQKITTLNAQTIVLSPEAAVWKAELNSSSTDKDGITSETKLTETWVWQKVNGEWKVIHFDESWL